jgi:hypothetical protein
MEYIYIYIYICYLIEGKMNSNLGFTILVNSSFKFTKIGNRVLKSKWRWILTYWH